MNCRIEARTPNRPESILWSHPYEPSVCINPQNALVSAGYIIFIRLNANIIHYSYGLRSAKLISSSHIYICFLLNKTHTSPRKEYKLIRLHVYDTIIVYLHDLCVVYTLCVFLLYIIPTELRHRHDDVSPATWPWWELSALKYVSPWWRIHGDVTLWPAVLTYAACERAERELGAGDNNSRLGTT